MASASTSELAEGTAPSDVLINVKVRGRSVEPFARRVRAHLGQNIVFVLDADRGGGLNVRSSQEQSIGFAKGKSNIVVRIDSFGAVDVEERTSDVLIAQIGVR